MLNGYETLVLTREGRLLTITMNRPETLNAFSTAMHEELVVALRYAATDIESDVLVLTGAGRAFSAGGDLEQIEHVSRNPTLFDREASTAKRLVFALLDLEKPIIAKVNGHAVGLGATLALMCDVIFAADDAKIGDPHVRIGLVAGDGGAVIWPHLVGLARAKELLFTGDLVAAPRAAAIGLINHSVPRSELDAAVDAFCKRLVDGATQAIRGTKILANLELKRVAHALMDTGIGLEALSVRSAEHREAISAARQKRKPRFRDADLP